MRTKSLYELKIDENRLDEGLDGSENFDDTNLYNQYHYHMELLCTNPVSLKKSTR